MAKKTVLPPPNTHLLDTFPLGKEDKIVSPADWALIIFGVILIIILAFV